MSPDATLPPGSPAAVGRYKIVAFLGRDAAGEVYRGFDSITQRTVAVKLLKGSFSAEIPKVVKEVFYREMQRAGGLSHPGIVMLYDAGQAPEGLFTAAELVEGSSLADWLAQNPSADLLTRLSIVGQIADALDHAHQADFPHLNLKPTSAIVGGTVVKLGGFGMGRVLDIRAEAASDPLRLTPYTAPERVQTKGGDARADLYSLALITNEVFGAPARLAELGIGEARWNALFKRALAEDPKARFASASAFLAELSGALDAVRLDSKAWTRSTGSSAPATDRDPLGTSDAATAVTRPAPAAPPVGAPAQASLPGLEETAGPGAFEPTIRLPKRRAPDHAGPEAAPASLPTPLMPAASMASAPTPAPAPAAAVESTPATQPIAAVAPAVAGVAQAAEADREAAATVIRPREPRVAAPAAIPPPLTVSEAVAAAAARKPAAGPASRPAMSIAALILVGVALAGAGGFALWRWRGSSSTDAQGGRDIAAISTPDPGTAAGAVEQAGAGAAAPIVLDSTASAAQTGLQAPSPSAAVDPAAEAGPSRAPQTAGTTAAPAGTLRVVTSPAGASVVVNGRPQGTAPLRVGRLRFAEHTVRVSLDGYVMQERRVRLTSGRPAQTIDIALVPVAAAPVTGGIAVDTNPAGASLTIDRNPAGVSPSVIRDVSAGRHVVRAEKDGFEPSTREVDVRAGDTIRVELSLSPSPPAAPAAPSGPIAFERVEVKPEQIEGAPSPPYPPSARFTRLSGSVQLRWVVDEAGRVSSTEILDSTSDIFEAEVLKWIRRVRYRPGQQGGKPVKVVLQRRFTFRSER